MSKTKKEDAAPAAPETATQRRRINRGSTRRIVKALGEIDKALADFTKEMDLQFYEMDADGKRVGPWAFVGSLIEMRTAIAAEVNNQLHPAKD